MLKLTKSNSEDFNINIGINNLHEYIPKNEAIKKYINYETEKAVAQTLIDDKDVEHITFIPAQSFSIIPYFNNNTDYGAIGIKDLVYVKESFYIFDVYDNFSEGNQKLLSRNFLKLLTVFSSFTSTLINFPNSKLAKGYRNIYIPADYINNTTADTFYLKISFFNSANGKLRFFQCNNQSLDSLKNYLKITLDKANKTYYINNGNSPFNIYEIIQEKLEKSQINDNGINKLGPPELKIKTITNKGKFI